VTRDIGQWFIVLTVADEPRQGSVGVGMCVLNTIALGTQSACACIFSGTHQGPAEGAHKKNVQRTGRMFVYNYGAGQEA
ncbi:MAG: hypothetical protein QXT35_04080, partial [Conexivisphaerales archaeon]